MELIKVKPEVGTQEFCKEYYLFSCSPVFLRGTKVYKWSTLKLMLHIGDDGKRDNIFLDRRPPRNRCK